MQLFLGMVVVRLYGGLGNQMFQYALGRHLALSNNTDLLLDVSWFENDPLRDYELKSLNVEAGILSRSRFIVYKNWWELLSKRVLGFLTRRELFRGIKEEGVHCFEALPLDEKGALYLDGYWQVWQHLESIKEVLWSDFSFQGELGIEAKLLLQGIKSEESVSLHIRRGDYVNDSRVNEAHGVCSMEYYRQAVDLIAKRVVNPVFFVFSDDIEWVRENLVLDYPVYYEDGGSERPCAEAMTLMSQCKHNIIANSTFSWWGAYLNQNAEKIVIAPSSWYALEVESKDLLPEGWVKLS